MSQVQILPPRPNNCFGWKPRPVLTRPVCEERYLDEVPNPWGTLKGKLVSLARRLYARRDTAVLHQINGEVDEESGWAVTPTQWFESTPHPTLKAM